MGIKFTPKCSPAGKPQYFCAKSPNGIDIFIRCETDGSLTEIDGISGIETPNINLTDGYICGGGPSAADIPAKTYIGDRQINGECVRLYANTDGSLCYVDPLTCEFVVTPDCGEPCPKEVAACVSSESECTEFECDYTAVVTEDLSLADIKAHLAAKGFTGDFLNCFTIQLAYAGSEVTGGDAVTEADMQTLAPNGEVCADFEQGGTTREYSTYKGEDVTDFYGVRVHAGSRVRFCGTLSNACTLVVTTCCLNSETQKYVKF